MAAKYLTEMQIRRLTDAVLFVILLSDLKKCRNAYYNATTVTNAT